ncbi:hypothetical protein H1R20_g4502, partial [Candolleomyces eurysporus]
MPQEQTSKKSQGKRRARLPPEMIDLPPAQHVAPQITLRRSQAVRTVVAFPGLAAIAKGFEPYLNPHIRFEVNQSLRNRLTTLILAAGPRLQEALYHVDTCRNADLISLATHVSFLFWQLCPNEFQAYFGTEGWYWLRDKVPLQAFAGLQSTGDPEQVEPPAFPKVILPGAANEDNESSEEEEAAPPEAGATHTDPLPPAEVPLAGQDAPQPPEGVLNLKSENVPAPDPYLLLVFQASSLAMELFPPGCPKAYVPGCHLAERRPKHDAFAHVTAPGMLPIYEGGPLFLQSSALRELTIPVNQGPVPSWVRPPCGQCASHGLICTGGDYLNNIRCDQCAALKQTCSFDTRIPRFTLSQQLAFAGKGSAANISCLISDILNLQAMAQIAASHAKDLQKMMKAKLETLSLVLQHVYSSEGDKGLSSYARNIKDLEAVLNFAKDIPLDTLMRFPERLHATTQQPGRDRVLLGSPATRDWAVSPLHESLPRLSRIPVSTPTKMPWMWSLKAQLNPRLPLLPAHRRFLALLHLSYDTVHILTHTPTLLSKPEVVGQAIRQDNHLNDIHSAASIHSVNNPFPKELRVSLQRLIRAGIRDCGNQEIKETKETPKEPKEKKLKLAKAEAPSSKVIAEGSSKAKAKEAVPKTRTKAAREASETKTRAKTQAAPATETIKGKGKQRATTKPKEVVEKKEIVEEPVKEPGVEKKKEVAEEPAEEEGEALSWGDEDIEMEETGAAGEDELVEEEEYIAEEEEETV